MKPPCDTAYDFEGQRVEPCGGPHIPGHLFQGRSVQRGILQPADRMGSALFGFGPYLGSDSFSSKVGGESHSVRRSQTCLESQF